MKKSPSKAALSDAERALWRGLAEQLDAHPKTEKNRRKRKAAAAHDAPVKTPAVKKEATEKPRWTRLERASAAPTPPPVKQPHAGDLPPIEAQLYARIAEGKKRMDAKLDLHGMTEDDAHRALAQFIERSAMAGHRALLVITGKGARDEGTLKRNVPRWLGVPVLRRHIRGMSMASRRHGGEGAIYLWLGN